MRRAAPFQLVCGLGWALCLSCGARHTGLRPEAALASSAGAQAEFRLLHERWTSTAPDSRPELERELTRFIQRYPEDPEGRWVRIYLAWIRLQLGDIPLAERWLGLADPGASGAATDLSDVVRASIDLAAGRAPLAYAKLEALEGQLIDADDRLLCLDRLVLASLAVQRYPEAVHQMLELAALAARRHRERVWHALEPRLAEIPLPALEASLPRVSANAIESPSVRPAERAAAAEWLRQQILQVLSQSAISRQDVGLAQRLVANAPAADPTSSGHSQLLWLATQGGLTPTIAGRTVGLALELDDAHLRQRSMQVAGAIADTLEFAPHAANLPPVQLETRQVEGEAVADALARLAGDGASLLVAGLDPRGARLAADFAAQHAIPVLLLNEPEGHPSALPDTAYLIGTDDEAADQLLRRTLEPRVDALITLGADDSACTEDGNGGSATAALMDTEVRRPGVLFVGDVECAASALGALRGSERRWVVGLGLHALGASRAELGLRDLWTLGVGRLGSTANSDPTYARWLGTRGRAPSWYEALGHDVARLAEASIPAAAAGLLRDPASVADVHRRVALGLSHAE
ncbi:MAG TPA: hypothetical protein VG963_21585, partial [Polyangiaceae bacterium]|nr:hypothetical protein [Polyangiaceae bacterium]